MVCPFCNADDTAVIDSRRNSEGSSVRRRRKCPKCNSRFTTYEKTEIELIVEKRSGNLEEFQIDKLQNGIQSAFGGQDITEKVIKRDLGKALNDIDYETGVERLMYHLYSKRSPISSKIKGLSEVRQQMNSPAYKRAVTLYKRR